jgi:glutamate-1-semialdehyde 2,1-aminomutase
MNKSFAASNQLLCQAEQVIPLGSQTYSKSKVSFPYGVSPLFIERGKGATVWDPDGNQYTDYVNGLMSVTLGYCDPDVDAAVKQQLSAGVTFSLPHRLETQVAELLVDLIPCAEMVRFGKNGTDVTSAAIRLARAYTGKEHILVGGYHGWQDWYIGSTSRNLGVPEATKTLTHKFTFNDIGSIHRLLDALPDQVAAIILEPMNDQFPAPGFLQELRRLCTQQGVVLIFDEMITGFRFDLGGAQKLFGVTPDLATFGKGMANGFPLSAIVGRKDLMLVMNDIFFSGTFGGETLSLAAAKATIEKFQREPVLQHIHRLGHSLTTELDQVINKLSSSLTFSVRGHPCWSSIAISGSKHYDQFQLKSLYLQEMFKRGNLTLGGHTLSYSHTSQDIVKLVSDYQEVIQVLEDTEKNHNFADVFDGEVIKPVFTVRS